MTEVEPITSFSGDYAPLSNFWRATVKWEGVMYPTNEHAFQAAKTFDNIARLEIVTAEKPGHAKKLGRKVELRPDWEDVKIEVMALLAIQKFTSHESLRKLLLSTGDRDLIEGNDWGDDFWGAVRVEQGARLNPAAPLFEEEPGGKVWSGQNNLGKVLMATRRTLRRVAGV